MIIDCTEGGVKQYAGDPSLESQSSEWNLLLSKLLEPQSKPDVADPLLVPDLVNGLCEEVLPFAGCQKGGQEK